KTQNLTISLGSGTLKLSALLAEGGEPLTKGVVWRIYGEANEEGDRPEVSYSFDPEPTFSIPAGTYDVAVSVESAKVRGEVLVKAGQVTEQSFILGAGRLHVTASAAEGQPALKEGLSWEVFAEPDAEGESEKVSYSYDPETTFSLAAGRY